MDYLEQVVGGAAAAEVGHEFLMIDTVELDPSTFAKLKEVIEDNKDYEAHKGKNMRNTGDFVAVYKGDVNSWDPLHNLMKELKAVGIKTDPGKWKAPIMPSNTDPRDQDITELGHESFVMDTGKLDPSTFSKFREIIKDNKEYEAGSDQGTRNTGKYVVKYVGKVPMENWEPLIQLMKELYSIGIKTGPGKGRILHWNGWEGPMIAWPLN